MFPIVAGIAAGSVHVASGPDHLLALAPIAVASRLRAVWIGAAWGVGHGVGVVLLGLLGLWARGSVDVVSLSAWSEFLVGGLLVGLGCWSLCRALRRAAGMAAPAAGTDASHLHLHLHLDPHPRHHLHGAFGVGVLHGAAGLGHLFSVVPSLTMTTADAVQYLAAYLFGAVLTMALFGWLVGLLSRLSGPRTLRFLFGLTGTGAIALGGYWAISCWP